MIRHGGRRIIIDIDGGIDVDGELSKPFPCQITNVGISDSGMVATWVDHELRLARMALLDYNENFANGISKADLRLNRNTAMVSNSKWCHILDAEPVALKVEDDKIFFALWSRGIYCIDMNATELWRLPLFDEREKTPPRSNEVTTISVVGENIVVWSRGGKFKRIESNTGEIIEEGKIDVECDLEVVFNHGENFLLSSNDGWIWEYQGGEITVARKLRGSIQDAVFDGEDWRIICWRDDIMLRGDSTTRKELGVQLIFQDEIWQVLDNQGQISPHMNA